MLRRQARDLPAGLLRGDKPKLNEVLRLIVRLGGFLDRKGDGEPGVKAIWLGLKEVYVAARTLQSYGSSVMLIIVYKTMASRAERNRGTAHLDITNLYIFIVLTINCRSI